MTERQLNTLKRAGRACDYRRAHELLVFRKGEWWWDGTFLQKSFAEQAAVKWLLDERFLCVCSYGKDTGARITEEGYALLRELQGQEGGCLPGGPPDEAVGVDQARGDKNDPDPVESDGGLGSI